MSEPNIFPALRYRDADAAVEWLKTTFGFEEKAVFRNEDGKVGHAELRLGAGLVMFGGSMEDGWLGGGRPDPLASTVSIYVRVDDLEAHFTRAKARGATIVQELKKMDYGTMEYSARDLEGNLWSFGDYDPNA
jgi:uncharacterized glyoxalase superfamily protein PhnB